MKNRHLIRVEGDVLGASSGAGVAVIMAVTYPDIYATAMSMAGAEYKINEAGADAAGSFGIKDGGPSWFRTSDLSRVRRALSR